MYVVANILDIINRLEVPVKNLFWCLTVNIC